MAAILLKSQTSPLPATSGTLKGEIRVRLWGHRGGSILIHQRKSVKTKLAQAVLEAHPDILVLSDRTGRIADCFGPTQTDFDKAAEWFVGRQLADLLHADAVPELLEKAMALENPRDSFLLEEVVSVRNQNRTFEARVSLANGELFLVVLRDANTFGRSSHRDFQRNKFESLAALAGSLAHDLNNTLTIIQGFVSLIRLQLAKPERVVVSLDKASAAAKRAAGLTGQLQALARGGRAKQLMVGLRALAAEAASLALVGSPCPLAIEAGDGTWTVKGDPERLSLVFHNLVLNAVQAMPHGGTVTLVFRRQSPMLAVSVVDEGLGIPTELQQKIFEPYFSTRSQATGLGLSVAREVVQEHGGVLEVESRAGEGSVFTVFLPAVDAFPDAISPIDTGKEGLLQGHRVLVMEDEGDLREFMVEVSASLGLEASAYGNGRDAVAAFDAALAENRPFSLVVSDLLVPGDMGGREMIAQLRTRDAAFRALAVTGFSTNRVEEDFHQQGFDVIVGKPFTVDVLKSCIVELMKSPWKTASNT